MPNISKKPCSPSTRKVLDFDLNGQHMRKAELPERHWVLGCSPDHSTIRSLKSKPRQVRKTSPKDKSERQVRKTSPKDKSERQVRKTSPKDKSERQVRKTSPKDKSERQVRKTSPKDKSERQVRKTSPKDLVLDERS